MEITNEGIKAEIELLLKNIEIRIASLDNEEHTLEIKKELALMQEKLEGLELKIEQEENYEYRLQQEEQQDLIEENQESFSEQQQQEKEALNRVLQSDNPSQLPPTKVPTQREVLEIKRQFNKTTKNFKNEKNQQEFEHSDKHIDDEINNVKPTYNKDLGTRIEQKGSDSLNYSKNLKEVINCANDPERYTQENRYSKISDISPVPTPEGHQNREEEDYFSSYTTSAARN